MPLYPMDALPERARIGIFWRGDVEVVEPPAPPTRRRSPALAPAPTNQTQPKKQQDPEFAEMFAEIQKGGMPALMKIMNDPKWLTKLGERLGDIEMPAAGEGAGAGPAAAAPPMPEVKDLHDAAKYGDLEGAEDFIAIGKDVNAVDAEERSPLHFAAGAAHLEIAEALIDAGANLESVDSKGNTPLMYAAGYGRPALVALLLDKGASVTGKNGTGKTAADLARLDSRNPVSQDAALMARLDGK